MKRLTPDRISQARTATELYDVVEDAAYERGCELDASHSYIEMAEWFEDEAKKPSNHDSAESFIDLAAILRAAEERRLEIEG